jgi:hypothetical protein
MQKEIAKNILHQIPFHYMTMRVSQQTVLFHEKRSALDNDLYINFQKGAKGRT